MRMFLTAVCLITGLVVPVSADACSCQEQSVSEAKAAASAVFEGRVVSVTKAADAEGAEAGSGGIDVVVEVDRAWKGISADTVTVNTPSNGAACGYAFKEGADYMIYATADETSALRVSLCSRTKLLSKAKKDHKILGEEDEVFRGGHSVRYRNEHSAAALTDRSCTIGVTGDATPSALLGLLVVGALCVKRRV